MKKIYNIYEYAVVDLNKNKCIGLYKSFKDLKAIFSDNIDLSENSHVKNIKLKGVDCNIINLKWYYIKFKPFNTSGNRNIDTWIEWVNKYYLQIKLNTLIEL